MRDDMLDMVEEGIPNLGGRVINTPLLHLSKAVAASEGVPIPVYVGKQPAPELGEPIGYGIRQSNGTVHVSLTGEKPEYGNVVRIYAVDEED